MLLYPGGFTVFFGQSTTVESYFRALGFTSPKGENPADFFLDVISGTVSKPAKDGTKFVAKDLCHTWKDKVRKSMMILFW